MKTEIDLSIIETALLKLGEATARQIADEAGLEAKDVTRALNTMLTGAVERQKHGSEYVYWLTTAAAPTKPTAKPKAAAVAVQALHTPGAPADITEQLRQARAEQLAMRQTIVEICCAIGHDPQATTTSQLPNLVKNAIASAASALADDKSEKYKLIQDAICAASQDLFEGLALWDLGARVLAMGQLIDAQHELMLDQGQLIADQERQIIELRARVEAQILAGHQSASSSARLLTEVHEVLAEALALDGERPTSRTTLQLAQGIAADYATLYREYLEKQRPTPDAYLVTRHLRAGLRKTVADPAPTRHKSIDTATRKARAAIRGGYVRAEIHATNLIAVATFGAEIKPV